MDLGIVIPSDEPVRLRSAGDVVAKLEKIMQHSTMT